jgi:hypothetical protein
MTVQCVGCNHFDLRSAGMVTEDGPSKGMAKHGFGNCKADRAPWAKARFQSALYPRECSNFKQAPQETAAERLAWLQKQKEEAK